MGERPPRSNRCPTCGADKLAGLWTPLEEIVNRIASLPPESFGSLEPPTQLRAATFLRLLNESGLARNHDIEALCAGVSGNDLRELANVLIAHRVLTRWQCEKLFRGQYKGFYVGRYRLFDHLPLRQHGRVFLGRHVVTGRSAEVEVLPPQVREHQSQILSLGRRLEALAALEHPSIACVLDADIEGDLVFIIREHIQGPSLQEAVERIGPLSCGLAATICAQVAGALACAHEKGYVYGCLAPRGILLSGNGVSKVATLGLPSENAGVPLRRLLVREQAAEGYVEPVLLNARASASEHSDLYSLGRVLSFALTGLEPNHERLGAMLAEELIGRHAIKKKQELASICRRLSAAEACDGFRSAPAVAEQLAAWLEGAGS